MKQLSIFHKLLYAGVDLSSLSKEVSFHRSRRGKELHSGSYCYNASSYEPPVVKDRIKVPATSACPQCFDRAFQDSNAWLDTFKPLGASLRSDDMRFLKSALNEKSKKNTPEEMALRLANLEEVLSNVRSADARTEDAKFIRANLVRTIEDRARLIRKRLRTPESLEQATRSAVALDALFLENGDPDIPGALLDTVGRISGYSRTTELKELLATIAQSYSMGAELPNAFAYLKDRLNSGSVQYMTQFRHLSIEELQSHQGTLDKRLAAAWKLHRSAQVEEFFGLVAERFKSADPDADWTLAHVQASSYVLTDDDFGKMLSRLVELYEVARSNSNHLLYLPGLHYRAVLKASAASRRSYKTLVCSVPAPDVTPEIVEMAATFYNFGQGSSASKENLQVALDAAIAMEQ